MATVRFSDELKREIRLAAYNLMAPQVDSARNSLDTTGWADRVYYHVVPVHFHQHIAALPSAMFNRIDEITIVSIHDKMVHRKLPLNGKREWPNSLDHVPGVRKYQYDSASMKLVEVVDDFWRDMYVATAEWETRVNAAEEARKQFVEKVMTLIGQFSTLAPALKAWPPLWDLIPEPVKSKHKEVVERAPKKGAVDIDMSDATAVLTISKFKL